MSEQLLPCPFCGDVQFSFMDMTFMHTDGPTKGKRVKCQTCGAQAPDTVWNHRLDIHTDNTKPLAAALARIEELANKNAALLQQAQIHEMEATTARSTLAEIYRIVTGGRGEPGDWNGAEPVRKRIEELKRALKAYGAVVAFMVESGQYDAPMEFLHCWNEGEFDSLRKEWPDAPLAIYYADPLADHTAIDAALAKGEVKDD